jgi:predicted deacylase
MKVPFFPELIELEAIIEKLGDRAHVEIIDYIEYENYQFPIHCITLGSEQKNVPVIMYFGGVHGLEKIGTEILISYLHTIAELLEWDRGLADRLKHSRMVFVPIVNPVGVFRGSRCNPNGVDLMRNAPIDGMDKEFIGQIVCKYAKKNKNLECVRIGYDYKIKN